MVFPRGIRSNVSRNLAIGGGVDIGVYSSRLDRKDKGAAIAAVIAIHAALAFAILHMSGTIDLSDAQRALAIFDINEVKPPPPPPPPPPKKQVQQPKPKQKEGGSAPKNIKSETTSIVAPKPIIETPPVQKIAATQTPAQGAAPTQGASDVRGSGTGGGGSGNGAGSGAGGNGNGGGEGDITAPPRLLTPTLTSRDYPRELTRNWPRGAQVFVALRIEANGYVSQCRIDRPSGVAEIDAETCNLAHLRFRFRPAVNRLGQPVASWFGYRQADVGR